MMPEMDGFEFLAHLRNNKAWQGIPVIVVTAKTLTAADHKRLKGSVEMLVEKGGDEIDTILASLKKMLPVPSRRAGPTGAGPARAGK
jgi:CheY-like chemotaxis protein